MYTKSESIMSHAASSEGKAKLKESGVKPERLSVSEDTETSSFRPSGFGTSAQT